MSPTAFVVLFFAVAAFLLVGIPVLVFIWVLWKERRAKAREIDEHTDEYWRQIG